VRFEFLTIVALKCTIFWDVMSCSLVEVYCGFGSTFQGQRWRHHVSPKVSKLLPDYTASHLRRQHSYHKSSIHTLLWAFSRYIRGYVCSGNCLNCKLNNSMKESPTSEAAIHSVGQKCLLLHGNHRLNTLLSRGMQLAFLWSHRSHIFHYLLYDWNGFSLVLIHLSFTAI
jgi:hypothetical protein